jgi:hypothetical protein
MTPNAPRHRPRRQCFTVAFADEGDAIDVLRLLVVDERAARPWSCWRLDRTADGRLAAHFVAGPHGVRAMRRRLAGIAVDVVVSIPLVPDDEGAAAQLTALLEQAASDFALHVVSRVPPGDGRRRAIGEVSEHLLRRCSGLDAAPTSTAELRRCVAHMGRDSTITGSLGAFLHVCNEAISATHPHVERRALGDLIDALATANDRRLGLA